MENKVNRDCSRDREGKLPARAPLAVPYIPFQEPDGCRYDAPRGLIRGTMFPGLDLPFMGQENLRDLPEDPLSRIQAVSFTIQELVLYLDTHREDRDALELLRAYQEICQKETADYEKSGGPLSHTAPMDGACYEWLSGPWPWEYTEASDA